MEDHQEIAEIMPGSEPRAEDGAALNLSPPLLKFIENMGLFFESFGLTRIGGRILGVLLVSHEPISAEQLAAVLKVSRSSISTNVRVLLLSRLTEQVSLPGDRRDFFVVSPQAWEQASIARIHATNRMKELAEQGLSAMPTGDPARIHLNDMVVFSEITIKHVSNLLDEWRSYKKSDK